MFNKYQIMMTVWRLSDCQQLLKHIIFFPELRTLYSHPVDWRAIPIIIYLCLKL